MQETPITVEEVKEQVAIIEELKTHVENIVVNENNKVKEEIKEGKEIVEEKLFSIMALTEAFAQKVVIEEEMQNFIQVLMETKNGLFYCMDRTIYDESGNLLSESLDDFSNISSLFVVLYESQYQNKDKTKILELCSKTLKIILNIVTKDSSNTEKIIDTAVVLIKLNKNLKKSKKGCMESIFSFKKTA
uniref:Uncharacterized protein n=1 Tax=viral metagenome TaxID=1070528 RepID=A0A6C0BBI3_9ZZZZ